MTLGYPGSYNVFMDGRLDHLISQHDRHWRDFDYVYPVISRRSHGLSLGVNLNVDGACNYDCIYCQVDRTGDPRRRDVDLDQLRHELNHLIEMTLSGELWQDELFKQTPLPVRRLNDIAFSGDGEPTASPWFAQAVDLVLELRERHHLSTTTPVVITNATRLDRPEVLAAIDTLYAHQGEAWAKLDAGTEGYFRRIDRPAGSITLDSVVEKIAAFGHEHPVVIQSMFLRDRGVPVPHEEFDAYLERLDQMRLAGCQISGVQLYTVARPPAEAEVGPLTDAELEGLAARLGERFADLPCEVFGGVGATA